MERAAKQQSEAMTAQASPDPDEAVRTRAFDRACKIRGMAAKILHRLPASEHPLVVRLRAALTEVIEVYDEVIRAIDSTAPEQTGHVLPPRLFQ
jgi:hypothetical protein